MIIGFWSEKPGRGSSTYNMIAAGLGLSSMCRKKIVFMQGKMDYNRIEYAFTPYDDESMFKEDYGYYNYGGIDSVISKIENGLLNEKEFNQEIIRIRKTNLFYIPSSRMNGDDNFEKKFMNIFDKYADFLKAINDINMIELNNNLEYLSDEKVDKMDLLVINLPQDIKSLHGIIGRRKIMEKALFIVGNYDVNSENNIGNIRRKYGIEEKSICAVPYNVKFKDAVCGGRCQEYFERHSELRKNDSEYEFMKYVDNVSRLIMKRCMIGQY